MMIGPAGGTLEVAGGALTIPAGALATMTNIALTRVNDNVQAPWTRIDAVYRLTPQNTTFSVPVTFTWKNASATAGLYWWTQTGTSRAFANVQPAISGNDVSISNTHFSCVLHTNLLADPPGVPQSSGICGESP
jgi:hypothetical protein